MEERTVFYARCISVHGKCGCTFEKGTCLECEINPLGQDQFPQVENKVDTLEEAEERIILELAKESTAPDQETPDWMLNDIKRGFIAGKLAGAKHSASRERFKMPTDQQLVEFAILFNDGKLEREKLTDMVGLCELIIDRLYENGDILKRSSKED